MFQQTCQSKDQITTVIRSYLCIVLGTFQKWINIFGDVLVSKRLFLTNVSVFLGSVVKLTSGAFGWLCFIVCKQTMIAGNASHTSCWLLCWWICCIKLLACEETDADPLTWCRCTDVHSLLRCRPAWRTTQTLPVRQLLASFSSSPCSWRCRKR